LFRGLVCSAEFFANRFSRDRKGAVSPTEAVGPKTILSSRRKGEVPSGLYRVGPWLTLPWPIGWILIFSRRTYENPIPWASVASRSRVPLSARLTSA
jgi:hypothetical protein